ncbi:MAG: GtrA family protein [Pseudomonadota bacterium]
MKDHFQRGGRFLVAGAVGFVVDVAVFSVLTAFILPLPRITRLISIAAAIAVTFTLSRHYVFEGARNLSIRSSLPRYILSQSFGLFINYGSFSILITYLSGTLGTGTALVASTAMGGIVNYLGAHFFAFKERH